MSATEQAEAQKPPVSVRQLAETILGHAVPDNLTDEQIRAFTAALLLDDAGEHSQIFWDSAFNIVAECQIAIVKYRLRRVAAMALAARPAANNWKH